MKAVIGTPGDQTSIQNAAGRLNQDLCNQLGILKRAVEDSGVTDPNLQREMILHCGRDTLMLRNISPALTNAVNTSQTLTSEQKKSLNELNRALLSVANGVGMEGKGDIRAEVKTAGAHMQNRWNPAIADFIDYAAARADPNVVNQAVSNGAPIEADYATATADIAARRNQIRAAL